MACEVFPALGFSPAALVDRHQKIHGLWRLGEPCPGFCCVRAGQGCPQLLPVLCSCPPQVDPYLPYEYTCEGMLERIHAYIQHQVGDNPCPPWGTASVLVANFPSAPWGASLLSHGHCAGSALIAESTRSGAGGGLAWTRGAGGWWRTPGSAGLDQNKAALGEEEVREEEVHPPQQEMSPIHAGGLNLMSKVTIPSVLLSHQQPPFPTVNISGH